jgi:hypothetical protein
VVSAVLLGLLGVPDQVIVADYAATQENLDAIIERLMSTEGYHTMLSALPPDTLHAEPETMLRFTRSDRTPARALTQRRPRVRVVRGAGTARLNQRAGGDSQRR